VQQKKAKIGESENRKVYFA